MQLNLSTDYALRCLLALNGQEKELSSHELSIQIGIEREFTLKILRMLREGGFVNATKGKSGGYHLNRPLSQITMLEVLSAMEDTMFVNRCLEPDAYCSRNGVAEGCPAHSFYLAFQGKMEDMLRSITLQDVVDESYKL